MTAASNCECPPGYERECTFGAGVCPRLGTPIAALLEDLDTPLSQRLMRAQEQLGAMLSAGELDGMREDTFAALASLQVFLVGASRDAAALERPAGSRFAGLAAVREGIEMSDTAPIMLKQIVVWICEPCLNGAGEMCHVPGCALIRHKVDLPINPDEYVVIGEQEVDEGDPRTAAYGVGR